MNAQLCPLSETRGYVGGGNVAGILGLSPYKSPLDEYLTITGEVPEEITPEKAEFFEDRRDLEPWAAKKFTRKTGLQVVRANERYSDPEFAWMKAEIDFEPEDGSNGETKTVHPNAVGQWGDPDSEEPPLYVTAQVMHGLGVTGREQCYVQALIGFDDYRLYVVKRDDELIAEIRKQCLRFWTHYVEARRRPQPTTVQDLLRLYKRDSGRAVEAGPEIRAVLEQLVNQKSVLKRTENQILIHELDVKQYMRDATTLTVAGQAVATWKADSRGVRSFRLK
jgi:putative phage-type endonuclease